MIPNPTERFTGRVESYRRFRPRYPSAIVELLRNDCGLAPGALVADVAAGTGLLTEIFLEAGFPVTAVEPNDEMRAACGELESRFPHLRRVAGTAEATGLATDSVELITVAQAMHWFDLERTRAEFARILKPGGWCAVIYNNRRPSGDAFHEAYESFLREYGIDYHSVRQQHVGRERLAQFFAPSPMKVTVLPNPQAFNLAALEGRILSSSYIPQPGQPRFAEMQEAIVRLFDENESGGAVTMIHDCVIACGQLL